MYKKIVVRNGKSYEYWYSNYRQDGKVKNVFLGTNGRDALRMERNLRRTNYNLLDNAPQPSNRSGATLYLVMGVLLLGGVFFYLNFGITGFAVYDGELSMEVNDYVSENATVILLVDLEEYARNISDYGFDLLNESVYYIDSLDLNLGDFGLNLDSGEYPVALSLIDNGELVGIVSDTLSVVSAVNESLIKEVNETEAELNEILIENETVVRKTNNMGGLEGGMTNGEDVVVRVYHKPLSTLYDPLPTVDIKTKKPDVATVERSDVSVVARGGVISEAMLAYVLAQAVLEKFGGDSIDELKTNYKNYKQSIKDNFQFKI